MKPRHEWKHEITAADRLVLSARLSAVARRDRHGQNGRYEIRSLYFDDLRDTALREKLDGVAKREKFRIRYYGGDISYICLEKKSKRDGLCGKRSVLLSVQEVQDLLEGALDWMPESGRPMSSPLETSGSPWITTSVPESGPRISCIRPPSPSPPGTPLGF